MPEEWDPVRLAELHQRCFDMPRPWRAPEFAALLEGPGTFILSSEAGFVLARVILDEAEILTLAIDPARRRQGEGRVLVGRFLQEAARRGATRAFLEVARGNDAAIALYHSCGFGQAGMRKAYYINPDGRPVDALVLARKVA